MENEIIINGVTYVRKDNQKKQSKRDNGYRFINTDGDILRQDDEVKDKDKPFVFPTEAEAAKARDKMLALYRIKEYAEDQWGEFIPDWDNHSQGKYFIVYNYGLNSYTIEYNYVTTKLLPFYLTTLEHCEEIIEKFKDDLDILFDKVS